MFDMFMHGLSLLLSFQNFVAIICGTGLGVLLGAIPGLTGIMAIALIIPFTYHINPITALILLMGVSKGATYGGSISAILINTPGTPAASATALDGYPLARQGKSLKALKMALYASVLADTFSDLILIVVAGYLARMALKFGPPEYAMLIVFSLTIIGAVSGESVVKGMISAAAGLFIGTIGLDPVEGIPRFDFGIVELYEGIPLLPMMIGLFALSEILRQSEEKIVGKIKTVFLPVSEKPEDNRVTGDEMKRCVKPIARASIIGTFLGAIPGIGPTVAAFLSYGETRRTAKDPSSFGRGAIEGVAAAEAGNNAVCGANLIPLLTLGIPGDSTAAVLLGAFMIQGLAPGPLLFQKHGYIVYAFFLGLSSGNFNLLNKVWEAGFPAANRVPLWVQSPLWSKFSVVILIMWGCGTMMLVFLAGLKNIPKELHEAAEVDGANSWVRFWKISFPLLTPYIFYNMVVGLISMMQIFEPIFVLYRDNQPLVPSARTMVYYLWQASFSHFEIGYGSAISWLIFVIILIVTAVQFRMQRRWVHYDLK